jgi:hypothetical protein
VVGTAAGCLLLAFAAELPVLAWFGGPVTVLGLVLVGMWVRDRRRPPPPPDTPESIAANLPGKWYPAAILGIFAFLLVWFWYWSKPR